MLGFFATAFVIMAVILFYQNHQKLVTFNDLSPRPTPASIASGPITTPNIYQLVYQSSSTSGSSSTWTFMFHQDLARDYQHNRINYLLINGTLYNITSVEIQDSTIKLTLVASCDSSSATSFAGSSCTQPSWTANSTMFVLGYSFSAT